MKRLARNLAVCAVVLVALAVAGGVIYEQAAQARYRARGMPGKLVDIGGVRAYIHCAGTGSPTIVFDGGLGDASDVWKSVHPEAAKISRACVYDRLGLGWSETGTRPRSAEKIAEELHTLLRNAGEKPPFILVSHSMAGYTARIFINKFRPEVAGAVLLDVSHPDQYERTSAWSLNEDKEFIAKRRWWARLAPLGITRLQGRCEWRPLYCGRSYETTLDEFDAYLNLSPQQVRATGNFGALPLEVVAHDPDFIKAEEPSPEAQRDEDIGLELQKELSRLSTRGCLQIAKGSGHYVYDARMDMALAAIREVVAEAKDPSHTRHGCET